jgi:hypothetical protein
MTRNTHERPSPRDMKSRAPERVVAVASTTKYSNYRYIAAEGRELVLGRVCSSTPAALRVQSHAEQRFEPGPPSLPGIQH